METAPKNAARDGKLRPGLIPMDILIELLCPAYEEGIKKYERESWRRGFPVMSMRDALERHATAFFDLCEDYDPEAKKKYGIDKHHLGAAIFCLISAYHTMKYHPHLDDRRDPATGNLFYDPEEEKKAA